MEQDKINEVYDKVKNVAKPKIGRAIKRHIVNSIGLYVGAIGIAIAFIWLLHTMFKDQFYMPMYTMGMTYIFVFTLLFNLGIAALLSLWDTREIRKRFKNIYIEPMLLEMYPTLTYSRTKGIDEEAYKNSYFEPSEYEEFETEDGICGVLPNGMKVDAAQVRIGIIQSRKQLVSTTKFLGFFGRIKLDVFIENSILIYTNNKSNRFSNSRIETESIDFEDYFDIFAMNKVKALQIFTSDLIEKYVEFVQKEYSNFELRIEADYLYFRINNGDLFEYPTYKDPLSKENFELYYNQIFLPLELAVKTAESANKVL